MERVLLSTAYFPPVYYFSKIVNSSRILLESDENFLKQTYRNRCVILGANGPLSLTVPVIHGEDPKINIKEVAISYQNNWQTVHFRAIESAYRNSAYYDYYIHDLIPIFKNRCANLLQFNNQILNICLELIGCTIPVEHTTKFEKESLNDYRYNISPKIELTRIEFPEYHQVFIEKYGFTANLSILDLIFNAGPESLEVLKALKEI
jgi:hypothetical protein